MSNQVMKYCSKCGKNTLHVQPSTSHLLHLILTLCTFGTWAIVWILVGISNSSQGECTECGAQIGIFGSSGGNAPSPKTHVKCPDCRELVLKDARVCKHCGLRLKPQE